MSSDPPLHVALGPDLRRPSVVDPESPGLEPGDDICHLSPKNTSDRQNASHDQRELVFSRRISRVLVSRNERSL